ncbi:sterile alpha and TIR motif-containing protein 1 isoform X2 [Empidonax traillii]|uniref:sterile alpha and TIR motif-containing protein 1 isoform X2 n=1 Tax=Empidonax traillii TaxID=164674 RepID=UPI000FFD42EB|nr:sterile alpha and TIR motif-containing protein 1 isoform X2 [Empidonax traillii]
MLALLLSLHTLGRSLAMASAERLTVPECVSRAGGWAGGGSAREHRRVSPGVGTEVREALERVLPALRRAIAQATQATTPEGLRAAITEVFRLVEEAWGMPALGRDVAKVLCDVIRLEGGLDLLLNLLYTAELETKCQAGKLLEQILVAENRDRIARIGLGVILNLAKERDVPQLAQSVSGILEHMFKHTEETCFQLISDGGLDAILYWCRWTDPVVLRHCAMALANCAMYGGQANQRLMIEKRAAEWLFPLVFSKDDELIRLHACLAITVLATNKEIEKEVERSGTLALVEPFIASLDPERFACKMLGSSDNIQGRTAEDLQRLVPLLDSSRLEAQCIAAFYLCTEAAIKTRQKKTQIFGEIGATQSLKRIVCYSTSSTTSSLAKKVLRMIGEEVPRRILPTVPNWKSCEVQTWLQQIGFNKYCQRFLPGFLLAGSPGGWRHSPEADREGAARGFGDGLQHHSEKVFPGADRAQDLRQLFHVRPQQPGRLAGRHRPQIPAVHLQPAHLRHQPQLPAPGDGAAAAGGLSHRHGLPPRPHPHRGQGNTSLPYNSANHVKWDRCVHQLPEEHRVAAGQPAEGPPAAARFQRVH